MYLSTPDPYFRDIDAAAGTVENRAELELFGVPLEVRMGATAGAWPSPSNAWPSPWCGRGLTCTFLVLSLLSLSSFVTIQ